MSASPTPLTLKLMHVLHSFAGGLCQPRCGNYAVLGADL